MHMQPYTGDFYKNIQEGSRQSAKETIPIIIELIQPKSVIDVGCGVGTWLSVFKEYGVEDILGVDGDYVDKKMLQIPENQFFSFDLKKSLEIGREFDLVVSLEVAEHLPNECAQTFVDSLTRLGPVILFSAAIPFQGGADHINEQWLDYWAKYFKDKGYIAVDCIRKRTWQNERVEFWYAQNTLLFVKQEYLDLENNHLLRKEFENTSSFQLSIVHPKKYLEVVEKYLAEVKTSEFYLAKSDPRNMSLRSLISVLPSATINALKRRLKKTNAF